MSLAPAHRNYAPSTLGRVVAICEFCGCRSHPVKPDADGEPEMFELAAGWSTAPYPHDFVHHDGSHGAVYTCPRCSRRLAAGETLTLRAYPTPVQHAEIVRADA